MGRHRDRSARYRWTRRGLGDRSPRPCARADLGSPRQGGFGHLVLERRVPDRRVGLGQPIARRVGQVLPLMGDLDEKRFATGLEVPMAITCRANFHAERPGAQRVGPASRGTCPDRGGLAAIESGRRTDDRCALRVGFGTRRPEFGLCEADVYGPSWRRVGCRRVAIGARGVGPGRRDGGQQRCAGCFVQPVLHREVIGIGSVQTAIEHELAIRR